MTGRVKLIHDLRFGPRKGAMGTVVGAIKGASERPELIRVHFDGDPEYRTYGVSANDLQSDEPL